MDEKTQQKLVVFADVHADIIIGKNLDRHYVDVIEAIKSLSEQIDAAVLNNEDVTTQQLLLKELRGLECEIVDQY